MIPAVTAAEHLTVGDAIVYVAVIAAFCFWLWIVR